MQHFLIVWPCLDESTMAHKDSFEALDRSLQDLHGNTRPFGNALLLLAEDFRQSLPVIPLLTLVDEINACLKYSILWQHVKTLKLTTNMHVQLRNDQSAEIISHQLLEIGNGKVLVDLTSGRISLPHNFCNLVMPKKNRLKKYSPIFKPIIRITIGWVSKLFLHPRTKTSMKLKMLFSLTFKVRQSHRSPSTLLWKQMKRLIIRQNFWIQSICHGCHRWHYNWKLACQLSCCEISTSQSFATAQGLQ